MISTGYSYSGVTFSDTNKFFPRYNLLIAENAVNQHTLIISSQKTEAVEKYTTYLRNHNIRYQVDSDNAFVDSKLTY